MSRWFEQRGNDRRRAEGRGARARDVLATRLTAIAGVLAATDLRDASSLAAHGAATADAVNALIVFGT